MSHREPLSHQTATVRIINKYKGNFEFGWLGGSSFYIHRRKKEVPVLPVYHAYSLNFGTTATQPPDEHFNQ